MVRPDRRRLLVGLALAGPIGLLGACRAPGTAPPAIRATPTPLVTTTAEVNITAADLTRAREIWRTEASPLAYQIEVESGRGSASDGIAILEVVDGQVRSARQTNGQPASPALATLTVERLFGIVEQGLADAQAGRLSALDVLFDGHNGLPITISLTEQPSQPARRYTIRRYSPLIR